MIVSDVEVTSTKKVKKIITTSGSSLEIILNIKPAKTNDRTSIGTLPLAPSDQIPKRAPKNGSHIHRTDKIIPVRKVTLITDPNKTTFLHGYAQLNSLVLR